MFHTLPNLQEIYIADNQVSGPIPPSITNAFILSRLEISINYFTGQVPSLGKLQNLLYLTLEKNNLGDNSTDYLKFLKSLTIRKIPSPTSAKNEVKLEYISVGQPSFLKLAFGVELSLNSLIQRATH